MHTFSPPHPRIPDCGPYTVQAGIYWNKWTPTVQTCVVQGSTVIGLDVIVRNQAIIWGENVYKKRSCEIWEPICDSQGAHTVLLIM